MSLVAGIGSARARSPAGSGARLLALGGDAGLGGLGSSVVSTFSAGLDVGYGGFSAGAFGRLRVFVADGDEGSAGLRRRDFDETSDYLHLLRYLRLAGSVGSTETLLYAGELIDLSLGHGSLIRAYSNVTDPDHQHAGARLQLAHQRYDLELMLDNLVRPAVIAGRLGWRPIAAFRRLTLGFSAAVDPTAPRTMARAADGRPRVDSAFNLQAAERETVVLSGVDAECLIGDPDGRLQLTPYVDGNTSFDGLGLHLGAMLRAALGSSPAVLSMQAEYRLAGGDYAPDYFETFYDVTRYQVSPGGAVDAPDAPDLPQPKRAAAQQERFAGDGFFGRVGLSLEPRFELELGWRRHPGPDSDRVWTRLVLQPLRRLSLGVLTELRGLERGLDGAGLAVLGEARYRFSDSVYALTQYTRLWAVDEASRFYLPLQFFNIGLGMTWSM